MTLRHEYIWFCTSIVLCGWMQQGWTGYAKYRSEIQRLDNWGWCSDRVKSSANFAQLHAKHPWGNSYTLITHTQLEEEEPIRRNYNVNWFLYIRVGAGMHQGIGTGLGIGKPKRHSLTILNNINGIIKPGR